MLAVASLAVQIVTGNGTVLVLYSSRLASQEYINFNLGASLDSFNLVFRDLNTESCKGEEAKAVGVFIEEIFVNRSKGDSTVATIGPSCTDSAYAISRLANRSEISMTHLHTSPMPAALASQLPNSFGLLGPVELLADASIELIQHANWSQVIALYQDTDTEMNFMFHYLREHLSQRNMLGYSSILYDGHVPLKYVLYHVPIRVIFLLADRDLAWKVLCEAFHLGIVYPHYQWVIFRTSLNDILAENVVYSENNNPCHRADIMVVLERAVLIGYDNTSEIHATALYYNMLARLLEGFVLSQTQKVSLNGALGQLEMETEKYVYLGQILNSTSISMVYNNNVTDPFSRWSRQEFELIPSNFTRISDKVNIVVFYCTLTFIVIQIFIAALMQALTMHYRKTKAIKATSPNIQQIAYFGIYLVIASNLVFAAQTSLQIEDKTYAHLCSVYNMFSHVGGALLISSLCVRAWRLYRIFNHYMDPGNLLSDKYLTLIILGLVAVSVVICTLWTAVGNPEKTEDYSKIDFQKRVEIVQDVCTTRLYFLWFTSSLAYIQTLLIVAVVLSILVKSTAPKYLKSFNRNEIIILTYLTTALLVIGFPTYYLARYVTGNLLLEYITHVALFSCYTSSYLVFFFASPLIRAAREKRKAKTLLE